MRADSISRSDLQRTIAEYLADNSISSRFRIFLKSRFFNEPQNVEYEDLPPLNVDILHWFDNEERDCVEDLLLDHALLGNISCVIGLREIQSEKAIEPLRQKLDENNSSIAYTTEAAQTLLRLTGDLNVVDYVLYAIRRVGAKPVAARALRYFPLPRSAEMLYQLLHHSNHRIAAEALCSLLFLYGELTEEEVEERAELLQVLIQIDDDYRALAIATMKKIIMEMELHANNPDSETY